MAAASIIARLLQAGTRQGQKAAAALLRMLKNKQISSDPSMLSRNIVSVRSPKAAIDSYRPLDMDRLKELATPRGMQRGVPVERARALAKVREAASHGFPKGVKNTPGGMKTTKKGFEYRDATPNLGDITMRARRRGTKRKDARKLAELRKYVDFLSRGGAG